MIKEIKRCRICGNTNLVTIVDLGKLALTGIFPSSRNAEITAGPLSLIKCFDEGGMDNCGLVQLKHSYDLTELYGMSYGYRSSLNSSMLAHLSNKVKKILSMVTLAPGDVIIDIGSNDGSTLSQYPANGFALVGIDPLGHKFKDFYPEHIQVISDFFSKGLVQNGFGKAKIVTAFSMFYDLEDPLSFMSDIYDILDEQGIWVLEQSYLPSMLVTNSYDTICQEHLEYYALKQLKWMADKVGFKIIDIEFNNINGGSFSVTVAKRGSKYTESAELTGIIGIENNLNLDSLRPYNDFHDRINASRAELVEFVQTARETGKSIYGLGASTKGNVILQFCGITSDDIIAIGEVNEDKFGCFTPGTNIPIIPENEMLDARPDLVLALPWHFRDFFIKNKKFSETKIIFPLPKLEIV